MGSDGLINHFTKGNPMFEKLIAFHLFMIAKRDEEKGATAVEYGLMVALIAVAIIVTVRALGGGLNTLFQQVTTAL